MKKSRGKDLAINTIIIGIGKFSTQIVSFLLLPLYTSILTTAEYGTYDIIITIATFLLPAITLLMEESMFRFLVDCEDEESKKRVISQTTIYICISTTAFLLISVILNFCIKIPYFLIGSLYIITTIISALRNSLARGVGQLKLYAKINFISSLLHMLLNVLFIAIFKFGIYGLLLSGIISNIVSSVLVFAKLKVHKYVSFKFYDKELMKKMVKYSIPLVPNSLSWTIVNLSDRLVITGFMEASANGIYSMSYKFPNLMNTIYGFFYTAWKESSARVINDSDKDKFFNDIFKMLTNLMFAVSIGIIVCMPLMFNFFIKEAYQEAYLYIPILVIAMYYNNMSGYYGGIFSAYKDTKIMGITTIVGAVVNLIVNLLLIKLIGIYAAAISTLVSCMIIYYCRKFKVNKYVKLEEDNKIIGYIILIFTLILYYTNSNIWIKLVNFVIVFAYACFSNKKILIRTYKEIVDKIKK